MLLDRLSTYFIFIFAGVCIARDAQTVDNWATSLGSELWDLANSVARPDELKTKYKTMNARVEEKSGGELIKIISESVGRMLRRKMDAVRCILKVAETAAEEWDPTDAENITYVSGKYSSVEGQDNKTAPNIPENMLANASVYRTMELNDDSHFYNIPVNTNYSSVHIPTNVYDLSPSVSEAISWSEALDDVFRQNYRSDPALSWQYFGSATGMLRQYPAMQWRTGKPADGIKVADLYDCRIRSWFIEAATCSKDMVILVDASGSMEGMSYTIAKAVVASILDTLSNNDFVTILRYTNDTEDLVPCFKDKLVQATPENLKTFKESMKNLDPLEVANLTEAFTRAFTILESYRKTRGCGANTPCNQLIMLVTDGVASNVSEVFDTWNRGSRDNREHIPVRVFTYLLGREVTNVREIQLMACRNRGYYTHVHTQAEAQEQVLKYIPVIARPLVLQGKEHPVAWTHAYADVSNPALATWLWLVMDHPEQRSRLEKHLEALREGVRKNDDAVYIKQLKRGENVRIDPAELNSTLRQEYRLLTSVSIPVFDRKGNRNNETRQANLLGVAGTDVPINDIEKLTLPYKLGVNGYAFIVSNNGYVILHPDLRPVSGETLKENYNSIDLTEVEILDDGRAPRDPGPEVLELRQALVDHLNGKMTDVPVKLHYDDNKRVTLEKRDYYFAPLPGTPFGIAVAIPNYGKTWIRVGNEIEKNLQAGMNISQLFLGNRWRVHPGWVYCRYHYLEGHEFDSSEDELRYFISRLGQQDTWKWSDQYAAYETSMDNETDPDCGRQVLEDDDYYCNEELMQLLVFDARATKDSFAGSYRYGNRRTKELVEQYGIFLRFVATQSGLTRWQYLHVEAIPIGLNPNFGDLHRRAINEPWYKGAIFQHQIDINSVCLTVQGEGDEAIVTASMAVFPRDGGKNASAAVVGFQMPMVKFYRKFLDITTLTNNPDFHCKQPWIDCYLLDQNGYIVISEAHNDTGLFFGTVEGPVMKSMLVQGYFNGVDVFDYQANCYDIGLSGAAFTPGNPLRYVWKIIVWFFARTIWMTSQFVDLPYTWARAHSDEDLPEKPPAPEEVNVNFKCDKKRTLYIMNQTMAKSAITNSSIQCSRQFYAQRVASTNLLLVVVNSLLPSCYERLTTEPVIIPPFDYVEDEEDAACYKKALNDLPRRRLAECFTENILEDEIDACGRGIRLQITRVLILIIATFHLFL